MRKAYFIGLDIAKNVFQVFMADEKGRKISNKKLKRSEVKTFFANLPAATIGIEACATAHYWARTLNGYGHTVKLIDPMRVKAFLGVHNKTDAADARAICEALMHPGTCFIAIKTEEQQELDQLISMRERLVHNCTQLSNQLRSFLAERGIIFSRSKSFFHKDVKELIAEKWNEFGDRFQVIITEGLAELENVMAKIAEFEFRISQYVSKSEKSKKLMSIPGVGPLTATALEAHIGDANRFKNGRQMAAYLGVTPKEYSSGGKQKLLGITKRGNKRLRTLLVLAARAIMTGLSRRKRDEEGNPVRLSDFERWILKLQARIGVCKAAVAVANKLARIAWVIMTKNEIFNPVKAVMAGGIAR